MHENVRPSVTISAPRPWTISNLWCVLLTLMGRAAAQFDFGVDLTSALLHVNQLIKVVYPTAFIHRSLRFCPYITSQVSKPNAHNLLLRNDIVTFIVFGQ